MAATSHRKAARLKRKNRIRKVISGTTDRPRLNVFRSLNHIYAQVIDDTQGVTLVSASSLDSGIKEQIKEGDKKAVADKVGKLVAERAVDKGIKKVVFDRNGFLYHGRIKAVSEGARKGGLEF